MEHQIFSFFEPSFWHAFDKTFILSGVTGDVADEYDDTEFSRADDAISSMDNSDFEVSELPNGKFRCKMRVASAFFAAVIGKKGASKRRIEIETKARVDIPRQVKSSCST